MHLLDTENACFGATNNITKCLKFLIISTTQLKDWLKLIDGLVIDTALTQLVLHVIQTYFIELVDSNRDVHHLVSVANALGDAVQDFTVVHLESYRDAEF